MPSYCIFEKKVTDSEEPIEHKIVNNRLQETSICASCGRKKSRFVKKSEQQLD